MARLNRNSIFILALLTGFFSHAQLHVENIHYRYRVANSLKIGDDNLQNHSAILPSISDTTSFSKSKGYWTNKNKAAKWHTSVYPLANLSTGIQSNKNPDAFCYDAGLGLGLNISHSKFFITGKFLPYLTSSGYIRDSIQQVVNMDPGASRSVATNTFYQNELIFAYRPNRFFTFLGGNGKNFFGEGYRSLLLSDNAFANPFFKIETSFANVKYVNLYQMWRDNTTLANSPTNDQFKFSASHYISWNVTREFNISIFESVVWQAKDTLHNRGFDPNYLNPIVFYRPVEYGIGSADNVLLGANMSFKFNKKHMLYTQFILDDFLLSEIRARSRWWANKYGFQFGYKSGEFVGVKDLYFQGEINLVRPFTYSHKYSTQSYGHLNASVAHPVGANFYELVNIVNYRINKISITNKLTYIGYGVDTSMVNYGQNIFNSYQLRDGEYDHFMMQGDKKNVINETLIIEYPLIKKAELYLSFVYNWRAEFTTRPTQHIHSLTLGIKSRIWNRYTDF